MRYTIQNIISKNGILKPFHQSLIGCQCYPIIVAIGKSALIEYFPLDEPEHLHRLTTTPVVRITDDGDRGEIETENTIYILVR